MNLTQADNGFYSFRGKDTILSTIQLIVKEYSRYYKPKENKRLLMQYPADFALWNVTFMPKEEMGPQTVMTAGNLVTEDDTSVKPWHFSGRIRVVPDGIEINPITGTDSGTFEFRDPQGNLAQTVKVVVKQESTFSNVFTGTIFGVVLAVSACCYCLKKCCCCCKRSSKRAQTVAAPAVYSHGENQPADSSCSAADYSDQPMDLLNSGEPEINSLGSLVYNIVNIYENPPQPEVAPLGGQGATPTLSISFDCLSSDPDPEFELKGLIFSSAPLSSDTTFCDVYISEKLNFLKGVD
ncbi:uncharacterized protein LOC119888794 [Micropterus salmoides]|uniref:uncharacterized protein LOC119888794 n=1 Tax=Micropterus salmoides TaxID=27706 RepID=UPI0018EA65DC|nr:uncharacterized protein LOC119888794 [Micropterus salmoides]